MSRVSLSSTEAEAVERVLSSTFRASGLGGYALRALNRIREQLKRRPSQKKVAATKARQAVKATKRATKRERTSQVYEAVKARAGMRCECGCGRWFRGFLGGAQMDHFLGRARAESVETCWMLREDCHADKTNPHSRAKWLKKWIAHCKRHGYRRQVAEAERELEAEALLQQAAAAVKGAG